VSIPVVHRYEVAVVVDDGIDAGCREVVAADIVRVPDEIDEPHADLRAVVVTIQDDEHTTVLLAHKRGSGGVLGAETGVTHIELLRG
jgi:hypothetical protein